MRELTNLIRENPELAEEILVKKGVSFEDVQSLVKLMGLNDNIDRKNLEIHKNGGYHYYRLTFLNPINRKSFEEYIKRNNIQNYKIIKKKDLIYGEDFGIEFSKSKVRAYFCNP